MRRVVAIAAATLAETRRNRVAWSLLFFCLTLVLTSFMFQEVTIAAFDRIVRDVGIGAINIFGVLLSVFLGVGVVGRDIDRKTVYPIIAKPVTRIEYLFGKALGVWSAVALSLALMVGAYLLELTFYRSPIKPIMFEALALMMVEFFLLICISILASSFAGTLVAAFVSVSAYFIGHLSEDIYFAGRRSHVDIVRRVAAAVFFFMPNLERLNLKSQVSLLTSVPLKQVIASAAYGVLYSAMFLVAAGAVFHRRDLK